VLHLTKTKTSLIIWLNIVAIVARSVRLLSAHNARIRSRHSSVALSMMVWSMPCQIRYAENAASVHNTCLDKIVCYLEIEHTRTEKWNIVE